MLLARSLVYINNNIHNFRRLSSNLLLKQQRWSLCMVTSRNGRTMSTTNDNNKGNKQETIKAKFVDDDDGGRLTPRQRLKHMAVLYGPLATVLHIGLSLGFLSITYLIVKYGFDATGFLERKDFLNETYAKILSSGGTFGLAYAVYKAMMPFRVMVTIFLTPRVANKLHSLGLIKKKF